jgi:replicative DNA helicase
MQLLDFGIGLEFDVISYINNFFKKTNQKIKIADLLNDINLKNLFVKSSKELNEFYLDSKKTSELNKHYHKLEKENKLFDSEILVEIKRRYGLIKKSNIYFEVQEKSIEFFIEELKKTIKINNVMIEYDKVGKKLKKIKESNDEIPDNLLNSLLESTLQSEKIKKSNENTKDIMDRLLKRRKSGNSVIIPTYLSNIDDNYLDDGFRNGKLIFTGARPSVGKTAFALNIFYRQIINGHRVKYVTLESTQEEILQRLLTIHSNYFGNYGEDISLPDWKDGGFNLEQKSKSTRNEILYDFIENLFAKHVIDLSDYSSLYKLKAKLTHLATQNDRVELIHIDHMHELVGEGYNLTEFFRKAFIELRNEISRKYDQALNVIVQLNRQSRKNEKPGIDSIKYSGIAEQIGDFVIILDREDYGKTKKEKKDYEDDNLLEVNFGKSRDGKTGISNLKFFKNKMYITDFTIGDELATIPDYNAKNNDSCEIDQFLFLD